MAAAELTVSMPYTSLAAGLRHRRDQRRHDVAAADFDGDGNSYSEQALTAWGSRQART